MAVTNTVIADDPATNALPLPGGGTVGEASAAELARKLVGAGVSGADHANGKQANSNAYALHIAKIRDEAGKAAVASWISQHGGA
jgi:hypothetical protein